MLKRITFTGADEETDIAQMMEISETYPFVEWGILLPPSGKGRFPPVSWIQRLIGIAYTSSFPVQLAAHICPPWTGLVLNGAIDMPLCVGRAFDRIQINTHAEEYRWRDGWDDAFRADAAREYILQIDGLTGNEALAKAQAAMSPNITGLFDLSHGAGLLPDQWPKNDGKWIGYAGGLGPQNLAQQIPLILAAAGDTDIWIDMETHVRTGGLFDLEKVQACIDIAAPFINSKE